MRKFIGIILAAVLLGLSVIPVSATVTQDNNKSSMQSYAGQGKLSYTEETVLDFDSIDQFFFTWNGRMDNADKKQGNASLSVDLSTENPPDRFMPNCFETKDGAFNTTVTDIRKQTFKFWVYINNIDYLVCDHDSVHDTPQKDSGTLYISLAKDSKKENEFYVMHTLEGSGWHLVEFDLNVSWDYIKYYGETVDIGYFKVFVEALPGLEMKFDDLKKVTYKNDGYQAPELENNGRWLSTCDFDAIDGSIVSEWYGSSFDTSEKVQGSSSLQMKGRKIHEDYRVVWSGMDVDLNRATDTLHFDFYIEDMDVLGTHFEQRMRLCDTTQRCDCEYWYYYKYEHLMSYSNGGKGLQNGWNSIDIPFMMMSTGQELSDECTATSHDWNIVFNLMYWKGAYEDRYYNIKYDNMYVYEGVGTSFDDTADSTDGFALSDEKAAQIAQSIASGETAKVSGYSESDMQKIKAKLASDYPDIEVTFNDDGTVTVTEKKGDMLMYIVIGAIALVAVIFVVIVIILVKKKKKSSTIEMLKQSAEKPEN